MSCKTYDQTINGVQYVTTQWSATRAFTMKLKIVQMFGDALFELTRASISDDKKENAKESNVEKDISPVQILGVQTALSKLFEKHQPEAIVAFVKNALSCGATKRDGLRIVNGNFDQIFDDAGLGEMYKAFFFVVKSNYEDFFKGQKAAKILAKAEQLINQEHQHQSE